MAWNRILESVPMVIRNDMSNQSDAYKIMELVTSEPNAAECADLGEGYGVLLTPVRSGEFGTVVITGEVRVRAGSGGLAIGDWVTSAVSGWATKVFSGMAGPVQAIGLARSSAASGSFATVEMRRQIFSPHSNGLLGAV